MNFITLLSLFILSACSSSKNWQGTQSADTWRASFDDFNGKEEMVMPAQPGKLLYLSTQAKLASGTLSIREGEKNLSAGPSVSHVKTSLDQNRKIEIVGQHAKGSFVLNYPVYDHKQVHVDFDPNIELLNLCYVLTIYDDLAAIPESQTVEVEGRQVRLKDLYALNLKVGGEFLQYRQSKYFSVIKTYLEKEFYLHYADYVLSLDDFPNAVAVQDKWGRPFTNADEARGFTEAMNGFYGEIKFGAFLERYKPYYEAMVSEVRQSLPKEDFITEMEHLYCKRISHYNLYPSLTMSFSQGFGVANPSMVGNIFGSFSRPESIENPAKLALGFSNATALRTLCIHEFGHSFVNPVIDAAETQNTAFNAKLFDPVKDKMTAQGYDTWKICLYEHFVRAGEVFVTRLLGDQATAAAILDDNVANRSFIYLPRIVEQLQYWYDHEFLSKTYGQKVAEIIAGLDE